MSKTFSTVLATNGIFVTSAMMIVFLIGCSAEPTVGNKPSSTKSSNSTPVVLTSPSTTTGSSTPKPITAVQEQTQEQEAAKAAGGVLDKAAGLLEKAKQAAPTVGGTKKWFGDQITGASEATGDTAEATSKWIAETYKSLKDSGLTTADSAQEWLKDDWKNIGAWDYKVIIMPIVTGKESAAEVEQQLNELGSDRWQCFNVSPNATGTVMYFKRSRDSYMKHVPLKDVLHFVPFIKALDNSESTE